MGYQEAKAAQRSEGVLLPESRPQSGVEGLMVC